MGALEIAALAEQLILQLLPMGLQAIQAEKAGDQATLDAIKDKVVAVSNSLAPPGAVVVPVG